MSSHTIIYFRMSNLKPLISSSVCGANVSSSSYLTELSTAVGHSLLKAHVSATQSYCTCAPPVSSAGVGTGGVKAAQSACAALRGQASRLPPCPRPARVPCPGQGFGESAGPPLAAAPSCSWSPAACWSGPRCLFLCLCHCPDGGANDPQWGWMIPWKDKSISQRHSVKMSQFMNTAPSHPLSSVRGCNNII